MARSIKEIYDTYWTELQTQSQLNSLQPQIDDEQTLLSDLTTKSKVAEHRLWLYLFAIFTWMQETLFDRHKAETEEIVSANAYGTELWWAERLKDYQHGYALTFVNNRPGYSVEDEAAQVVKRAVAISQGGGTVLLKAATESGGEPVALSTAQLNGLTEYCLMIQPAGPLIQVISLNADKLRLTAEVFYDPLLFNPNGSLILTPSTYPVEDAINEYLANIPFNGTMNLTHLKDAVQAVEGVNDFTIDTAVAIQGGSSVNINRLYPTVAGYIREDDTTNQTFRDLFTYTSGS